MAERSSVVEPRRYPARISIAPRSSRASRSCSTARTPRSRWPRAPHAVPRWTPRSPSSTPAGPSPPCEWRRDYSLILGLERVLSEDEPHLVDGTVLSAHQVDALSGTLIALTAELLVPRPRKSGNGQVPRVEELPSGEVELEGDELTDEEPLDWDPAEEAEEEAAADAALEDPGASRRFWFEHATGAGKTVAALGLRGGLAHRRRADPHAPPQPRGPVPGRAARPRLPRPHLRSAAAQERRRAARRRPGDRRDLPVVRAQRGQDLGRLHDRHLRRGAHRARREDERRRSASGPAPCSSA